MNVPGAMYRQGSCRFSLWAPEKEGLVLHLVHPREQRIPMEACGEGYWTVTVEGAEPGTLYYYVVDGIDYPDPASYAQPGGVHQASEIIDHQAYQWKDEGWKGVAIRDMVLYELHVGCFTEAGTFEAIIPRLAELAELGITALELMPVTQFPGTRNWGYDVAYLYAVQDSYGGVNGLKQLVDACHLHGIAVVLDVVYNHFGPEGNYLGAFGPYFTDKYATPWGKAMNYDGEWSDGVKDFVVNNLFYWHKEFHIDGLRLDAVHTIFDQNARNLWEIIHQRRTEVGQTTGRAFHLIAECDDNSPRTVRHPGMGGQGFDAQWLDDFHHALFVVLYPSGKDRYEDFGSLQQLAKAYKEGFVHSGEYVSFRKRRHGASSSILSGDQFVAFNQNHDQIGNRPGGDRLTRLVDTERLKLAAAALLFAPYVPMLFMGEEYAEESPFFYFVDHSDPALIAAVHEGREKEFAAFKDNGEMPDAAEEKTFIQSKIDWSLRSQGKHRIILRWHQTLLSLRRSHPVLRHFSKKEITATPLANQGLALHRQTPDGNAQLLIIFNFSEQPFHYTLPSSEKSWQLLLHSRHSQWTDTAAESPADLTPKTTEGTVAVLPVSVAVYELMPSGAVR